MDLSVHEGGGVFGGCTFSPSIKLHYNLFGRRRTLAGLPQGFLLVLSNFELLRCHSHFGTTQACCDCLDTRSMLKFPSLKVERLSVSGQLGEVEFAHQVLSGRHATSLYSFQSACPPIDIGHHDHWRLDGKGRREHALSPSLESCIRGLL